MSDRLALERSVAQQATDEIDLLEAGQVLWRNRLGIIAITAILGLSSLGVSFVLPKSYQAEATILPSTSADTSSVLAASFAAQLGPIAGMLGGAGASKTADLVEILSSRSMAERVIATCKLDRKLKGWKYRSDLVKRVMKMTTITGPTLKNKSIDVSVIAQDPDLAAGMVNAYVSELKDMLDSIGYNSATKNRKFIGQQLKNTREELGAAEDNLAKFQANNQLVSLPETVVASIKAMSDLEAQRIGAEVQERGMDEALGAVKSRVDSLQADPNALTELEVKRKTLLAQQEALTQAKQAYLNKLASLPPKGIALARLQRDVQVQNAVYLALSQQFETAVINEAKESDAFIPLDPAVVPDRPVRPKKLLNTLIGGIVGLLLGIIYAFWRNRAHASSELVT